MTTERIGPRKVTLREVAERAGVHVSTASRALDAGGSARIGTATIERVQTAAAELGYSRDLLASALKRGQTKTIGVVVADLDNPHNAPVIRGIAGQLEAEDFVPLVVETVESRERFERVLTHLAQRRIDALITTAVHLDGAEILARLVPTTPVVLAIRSLPDTEHDEVVHDDETGGSLAAQHLVSLGHRRLAQLAGPVDIDTFVRRADGFSRAVAAASRAEVSLEGRGSAAPDFSEGRRLMEGLLDLPDRPTAVFAPTDVMAVGALDAIAGRGLRCPEDISVVGYNDIPMSRHVSPPLTTIELPSEELGGEAARMALSALADPGKRGRKVELPARLVERRSTGPVA